MANTKNLGLFNCILMLIGSMFGSAIFSLSGLTIYEAGPSALLSWLAAAPIMLIYGLITAELANYFPKSGGVYVFPSKAIKGKKGLFWGWVSCWGFILGNIAALAFSAIYVGVYLGAAFEWANEHVVLIALAALLFTLVLNMIKFRNTGIINNVFVCLLIILMIMFVIVCVNDESFNPEQFQPFFDQGHSGKYACLSMVSVTLLSYNSIVSIAFMASDIKDPDKNIPRASIVSIIILSIMYALILFATLGLVSADYLAQHPDLQMIPLFAACERLGGISWLYSLISIASVLALLTTMNIIVLLNARAIKAAAEDRILPKFFAKSNRNGQPVLAALATVILAMVVSLFPDQVNKIVNYGILFNILTIIIVVVSLLIARKKFKSISVGYRLRGGNFLPILFLAIIVLSNVSNIITSDLLTVLIYTIVLMIIGIGIFAFSSGSRSLVQVNEQQ